MGWRFKFDNNTHVFEPTWIGEGTEDIFLSQVRDFYSNNGPEAEIMKPGEWTYIFDPVLRPLNDPTGIQIRKVVFSAEGLEKAREEGLEKFKWNGALVSKGNEHIIALEGGEYLYNHVGKYRSGLCFVGLPWEWKFLKDGFDAYNVEPDGEIYSMRGDFFVSKKGTKCFRPKKNGKHILISVNWGGAFNRSRGICDFTTEIYYHRAGSNGGGSGISYWIVPFGWKRTLSIDEI